MEDIVVELVAVVAAAALHDVAVGDWWSVKKMMLVSQGESTEQSWMDVGDDVDWRKNEFADEEIVASC